MDLGDDESYKAAALSEVMSLGDMEDSMEADFLADLPKDGGALAALDRLDTPPPTPIFLSELESSPLSSAGLESPLGDSELEPPDQDTMTMDDLLNSCGVSCDASVDSPLLSSLDLMWGASPAPAPSPVRTTTSVSAPAGSPVPTHAASPAPEAGKGSGSPTVTVRTRVLEEKSAAERPSPQTPLTPEQQLQAEVQRLHRQQQQEEATKRLLERQVQQLQRQQQLQQRQDQQHQQQLIKQQKQAQRHQQRQKQHLHWQQHQLQVKQQVKQHYQPQQQQQQQQRSQQHRLHLDDSRAGPSASTPVSAASAASAAHRAAPKVRRKTRVITIPSSSGATVTVPHIVICTPSLINSRPSASSLPVTFSVQDRQTAAARVTARPTVTYSPRDQSRPLSLGVRRRVVGRAAPGSVTVSTLAKRYSVESAPSSPETATCSMLRLHSRKPVMKVTTATQTGEAVDEVLRNNDSTLIRLLVTGQDLTNGYKLCPDGQCLTPERQPAPPSLFAGLPDRGSSVLLSMLSHDDESQLPALFPSETAGRLLDDPL